MNLVAARPFVWLIAVFAVVFLPLALPRDHVFCGVPERDDDAKESWPMFGGTPSRNMVCTSEHKLADDWCIQEGKRKNIKWVADLGDRTIGSPVVADGKVFISTNNARDRKLQGRKAVIMAFRESDGQFLWQIANDLTEDMGKDLSSTPAVVDGKLYYVSAAGQVICAELSQGKIQWRFDMVTNLNVHLYKPWCPACISPSWCSPLVVGDLVFVATGNGIDDEEKLVSPKAPSFIALDKRTGRLVWQTALPNVNTIQAHFSSPAFTDHGGRRQVIFAGGDGVIYGFVPETGELLWKCDCLPVRKAKNDDESDNQFVGSPVIAGGKLYIGMGLAPDSPRIARARSSYFLCLDITKKGDVSLQSYNAKSPENKDSALVWAFGGSVDPKPERGRRVDFGSTVSTAAVYQGLVYMAESQGYLHCLDAATGSRIWAYDLAVALDGSPYIANGRVYVGTEDGDIVVFSHTRAARIPTTVDMEEYVRTTPVAANGVLYIATQSKLYAIAAP